MGTMSASLLAFAGALCRRFFEMFDELFAVNTARLLLALPSGMEACERSACLQDLERGRCHLLFAFSLKLSAWQVNLKSRTHIRTQDDKIDQASKD